MPNRLHLETSPYLLQHAENPVDWYPWGEEALKRAAEEDKPILLSIGYAACHWCHVMERESFVDEAVAAILNEHFVCIKVDREERPDLDDIYMSATLAINGNGGWPMTVFLTPETTPFFAGTYFPPDSDQRPGFGSLLRRVVSLWGTERDDLFRQAGELTEHIQRQSQLDPPTDVSASTLDVAARQLASSFDETHGGFGPAPKFPSCQALHLLMRHFVRTGDSHSLAMTTKTLDAMKDGGIYDQLSGGFARYSVDERWLVPHFEKMLYDNAQLARVYTEAFQLTKNPEYERVVRETLGYITSEMQDPAGGYFASTDADSEGAEGRYFVFTATEVAKAFVDSDNAQELTETAIAYFGISEAGNFDGSNVLHVPQDTTTVAEQLGVSEPVLLERIDAIKERLRAARHSRPKPATDDKVITAWNALMIGAMAEAARVFDEPKFLASAETAAAFIDGTLTTDNGELLRTARLRKAQLGGYLEDYAYLADALIDLYEVSAKQPYLTRAKQLADLMQEHFRDPDSGAFFQTSNHHEALIARVRDGNDGALPNASVVAARALSRLATLLGEPQLREVAQTQLRAYGQRIEQLPRGFLGALNVADALLEGPVEIVFTQGAAALRQRVAQVFLPHRVIAHASEQLPLAQGKQSVDGEPAVYICRDSVCQAPITDPDQIEDALTERRRLNARERKQQLASPTLAGHASSQPTERRCQELLPERFKTLGKTGLKVSPIGFGGYRIHRAIGDHQQALQQALRQGCNLVDTAAIYTEGNSERCVGAALSELVRRGDVQRDEVVVVSKIGIHQALKGRATEGQFEDKTVEPVGPGVGYSLNAEALDRQLSETLNRLGLETLDVCLLHNPEMLLNTISRVQLVNQLRGAFEWLETQAAAGRIQWFGLSSNTLGLPGGISLEELNEAASGFDRFAVVQVPLNPLEVQVLPVIEQLAKRGIGVLTNRPLNAITDDTLVRLSDAAPDPAAPDYLNAHATVAALEGEFRSQLGAVLGAVPEIDLPADELFSWSGRIGDYEVSSRELWEEFEQGVLTPQLSAIIAAMDRAFDGKSLGDVWRDWRQRYTESLQLLVAAAQQRAAEASNRRTQPFRQALLQGSAKRGDASLSQLVVWGLSSEPSVGCVLVGMRSAKYVQDALATLTWESKGGSIDWLHSAGNTLKNPSATRAAS